MPHVERQSPASLRSSVAALVRWATVADPREATKPAREGFDRSFLDRVDPTGDLARRDPAELQRRLKRLRTAHFKSLAIKRWSDRRAQRQAVRDA